jgi:periplasmic protein TonB
LAGVLAPPGWATLLPWACDVLQPKGLTEVFTPGEIARAANASEADVRALIEAGAIRAICLDGRVPFVSLREAVRAGRALTAGLPLASDIPLGATPALFSSRRGAVPLARTPFAISTGVHAGLIAAMFVAATLGLGSPLQSATDDRLEPQKLRLVYLALPGPGGGGGGGGLKKPAPPPKAERKGRQALSSPLPIRRPPPAPEPDPPPLPEVEPERLPPVQAPVVAAPSDARDRAGVLEETPPRADSRGPGTAGGVGAGAGTGIGEGEGSGLGDGSGGGTGGGPYRAGSGVRPPVLLREVRPDYTEEARARKIEGEVLMEIVVSRDGSVGSVRLLQGLGYGLDARATAAVRQWRFSPATRHGVPVDVLVEVAMEFKIR